MATVGVKDLTVMTDVGTNSMKNVETSKVNIVAPKGTPECLYLESSKFKGLTVVVDTATRAMKVDSNGKVSTVAAHGLGLTALWLPLTALEDSIDANESLGVVDTTVERCCFLVDDRR